MSNTDFLTKLERYAELIVVHGLNIGQGQLLNINAEPIHRELARLIAKAAYSHGACLVDCPLSDPVLGRLRIEESCEDSLNFVPGYITGKYNELIDSKAANLKLVGSEFPDILQGLSPERINKVRLANYTAVKRFYEDGIGKSLVHWCVAGAATSAWASKVFPNLSEEEALESLWESIFRICRVDRPDFLEEWGRHNSDLVSRSKKLSTLKIKELHFVGPDTDLKVALSEKAIFKGGREMSALGREFEPNLPTEEVFTTPDRRLTQGHVKATRPFMVNGILVKDLSMTFAEGRLESFSASEGAETFRTYVDSDPGGRFLGEVALVGIDSPIYQSGLIFQEILFDENAACHIAVGSAYKFCLENGANLNKTQLEEIGCNESTVHTDMMISSEKVDVTGTTYSGEQIPIIRAGEWVGEFGRD